MSNSKPHRGPGFLFGVALGTIVGAGALLLSGSQDTDKLKQKLHTKLDNTLDQLKTKYPQETSQVESVFQKALLEAKTKSQQLKQAISPKPATPPKKTIASTESKRTFTRKGKPLALD